MGVNKIFCNFSSSWSSSLIGCPWSCLEQLFTGVHFSRIKWQESSLFLRLKCNEFFIELYVTASLFEHVLVDFLANGLNYHFLLEKFLRIQLHFRCHIHHLGFVEYCKSLSIEILTSTNCPLLPNLHTLRAEIRLHLSLHLLSLWHLLLLLVLLASSWEEIIPCCCLLGIDCLSLLIILLLRLRIIRSRRKWH